MNCAWQSIVHLSLAGGAGLLTRPSSCGTTLSSGFPACSLPAHLILQCAGSFAHVLQREYLSRLVKRRLIGIVITAYNYLRRICEDIRGKLSYIVLNNRKRAMTTNRSYEGTDWTRGAQLPPLESQWLLATQRVKEEELQGRCSLRICFATRKTGNSILHDVLTTEKRTQDLLDGILKRKEYAAAVIFRKQASLGAPATARPARAAPMGSKTYVSLKLPGMQSNARQV